MALYFNQDFVKHKMKDWNNQHGIQRHLNLQDIKGYTPMHIAVFNRNLEAITCFINNKANMFIEDRKQMMPIDYARYLAEESQS
mmetsp:Transcript_19067/g.18205  ORF Transcript_19067/g.18205 Transcript_19067/m.18205 type:complete len:84 (+) Transcript_19067:394-645(+)